MIVTFLVVTRAAPMGGSAALYEFANGMDRRGHEVHVVHLVLGAVAVRSQEDISWFRFEDGIQHHFGRAVVERGVPRICEPCELPSADFVSHYDPERPRRHGLPFNFVQGYGMWPKEFDRSVFRAPCPKVCVAKWLLGVGTDLGVPDHQLVHVPCGINHDKYRQLSPLDERPPLVSMLYSALPLKRPAQGLEALVEVKKRVPELEAVLLSSHHPVHEIPEWMTFMEHPPQEVIVKAIYNRSRVFLCSSRREGLGLASIEAMACGAALVTTSNGGSDDYAIHGETALVCEPDDVNAMADHIESLLRDDDQRIRLAKKGGVHVRETFDWDSSSEKLEGFLTTYGAEPGRYLER